MKIEESINQSHFVDDYQRVIVNILYTGAWVTGEQVHLLKEFDLLPQHFNVLRIIKGKHPEPVSPGDIKNVMVDKAHDLTRLLNKLEKKELIVRNICSHNRRKIDVTITEQGIKCLKAMTKVLDGFKNDIQERISVKEAVLLSDLLDKITG